MDFEKYEGLLKQQSQLLFQLGVRMAMIQANPAEMQKMTACLEDGSIDPGDFEEITSYLYDTIAKMPEYEMMKDFARDHGEELGKLFSDLSNASQDEYEAFFAASQKVSIDLAVGNMLDHFLMLGLVVDKR